MLRKLYLILFLLLPCIASHAMEAAFSHALYYLPDPVYPGKINPYIEAYWQVNPKKLHYNTNADKQIIARIQTDVTITREDGHVLKEDNYVYETIPSASASQLEYLNILEMKRYFVSTGKFTIKVVLTDLNDTFNHVAYTDTFSVAPIGDKPFYGDIEFIDTSYVSDVRTPYRKHGRQNIPWSESFFPTTRNKLNYFTELYQLNKVLATDYPLVQSAYISKKRGQDPFLKYVNIDTVNSAESSYFNGSFDISKLSSGNYYLNISLGNRLHQTIASKSIFFQRMNTNPISVVEATNQAIAQDTALETINVLDLSKTFLKKYNLVQITAILKMLLPVSDAGSTYAIEGFLKKPEEMYMRYFIYNYFVALNKDKPEKAWKDYSERVKEVNKLFTAHGKAGYETERGFMYLRYGAPSEIITSVNESGSLPYEIWQYNNLQEKGGRTVANAVILFYKQTQMDYDFKVLHTTIAGELHNAAWRSFLYTNSDGGTNLNSRAEQYIGSR